MSTTSQAERPPPSRRVSACLLAQPPTPTPAKSSSPTSAIDAGPQLARALSSVELLAPAATRLPSPRTPSASSSVRPSSSPPAGTARTSTRPTTRATSPTAKDPVLTVAVLAHLPTPPSSPRSCTRSCGMSTSSPTRACGPLTAQIRSSTP